MKLKALEKKKILDILFIYLNNVLIKLRDLSRIFQFVSSFQQLFI